MTKQNCLDELRDILVRLQLHHDDPDIAALRARAHHLCDLLDAFEREGR